MKAWHLFISIVVILALVISPALAISKGDLIASYKGQSAPTIPTWGPTPTPSPLTPDKYPFSSWAIRADTYYPQLPASYYEWSKFPAPSYPSPEELARLEDEYWANPSPYPYWVVAR